MPIGESDEVKKREASRHNGGIKNFYDPCRATRDVIDDSWTASFPLSDDMINRGYIATHASLDESGHFLVVKFEKRENYVP
jgi:hypothetical protein